MKKEYHKIKKELDTLFEDENKIMEKMSENNSALENKLYDIEDKMDNCLTTTDKNQYQKK